MKAFRTLPFPAMISLLVYLYFWTALSNTDQLILCFDLIAICFIYVIIVPIRPIIGTTV